MVAKIRVVQYGCGPIGCSVAKLASQRRDIEMVGAIDVAKDKVGKDLSEVAGLDQPLGIIISDDANAVLSQAKPDIVLHTTSSWLKKVHQQLTMLIKANVNIVSTTEELSFPWRKEPQLAAEIDQLAKEHKVTVLATGINPGFLMDTWPLAMTAVCQEIKRIRVARIQDASPRRLPFQQKIGAGCTLEEFQKLVNAGTLRHVGLAESIAMIAAGLRWELDDIRDEIEPIVAESEVRSQYITVKPGQAAGVKQIGRGLKGGQELITLDFQAYLGAKESYDAVYITGTPNMEVVIKGGTHGDIATAAIVVNAISRVLEAPPGL
ncbi:MAG: dihydrodipicolinate reductase, partial [Dehalococcoidales bacterium]